MLEGEPVLSLDLSTPPPGPANRGGVPAKGALRDPRVPPHAPLRGPSVARESWLRCTAARVPDRDHTRPASQRQHSHRLRRAFEVPSAYRTLLRLRLRVARWDLSSVDLVDPRSTTPRHATAPAPRQGQKRRACAPRRSAPAAADEPSLPVGIAPRPHAPPPTTPPRDCPPPTCPKTTPPTTPGGLAGKLLSLYGGLKFHPFQRPDVPHDALFNTPPSTASSDASSSASPTAASPCSPGDPGSGKQRIALRLLAERLRALPRRPRRHRRAPAKPHHGLLPRAQGPLRRTARLHNRWAGFKALRAPLGRPSSSSHCRPVLIIDEAEETLSTCPSASYRILGYGKISIASSCSACVFASDVRLPERLRSPDLLPPRPLRIRRRGLTLDYASRDELCACLDHLLAAAGNLAHDQ